MLKERNTYGCLSLFRDSRNNRGTFLNNEDFIHMMMGLKDNLLNILELGFLEDCKNTFSNSIIFDNNDTNLILDINNIKDFTNKENIIEIVQFLDTCAACIVIEPNKNMYFDINYCILKHELGKSISPDAYYSLLIHEKVQKFAVINSNNKLSKKLYEFKREILINCDFQKNAVIFPYCCEALKSLELSIDIYG